MFDWLFKLAARSRHGRKRRDNIERKHPQFNPIAELPPRRPVMASPALRVMPKSAGAVTGNTMQTVQTVGVERKGVEFLSTPFLGEKYELHGIVGYGGFGVVYLVYSRELNAIHVLKTYHDKYVRNRRIEHAFQKEAQIWIALERHPNLVGASFVDKIGYRLFLAMEYVAPNEAGRNNLQHYLGTKELDFRQALLWAIHVCYGMEHAYGRGIRCHRDLKPSHHGHL